MIRGQLWTVTAAECANLHSIIEMVVRDVCVCVCLTEEKDWKMEGRRKNPRSVCSFPVFSSSCIIIVESVIPLLSLSANLHPPSPFLNLLLFHSSSQNVFPFLPAVSLSCLSPLSPISPAPSPLLYWKWDRKHNGIHYDCEAPCQSIVCAQE